MPKERLSKPPSYIFRSETSTPLRTMDRANAPAPGLISSLEAMIEASVLSALERRLGPSDDSLSEQIKAAVENALDHRLALMQTEVNARVNSTVSAAVERRIGTVGSTLEAQIVFRVPPSAVRLAGRRTGSTPPKSVNVATSSSQSVHRHTVPTNIHNNESATAAETDNSANGSEIKEEMPEIQDEGLLANSNMHGMLTSLPVENEWVKDQDLLRRAEKSANAPAQNLMSSLEYNTASQKSIRATPQPSALKDALNRDVSSSEDEPVSEGSLSQKVPVRRSHVIKDNGSPLKHSLHSARSHGLDFAKVWERIGESMKAESSRIPKMNSLADKGYVLMPSSERDIASGNIIDNNKMPTEERHKSMSNDAASLSSRRSQASPEGSNATSLLQEASPDDPGQATSAEHEGSIFVEQEKNVEETSSTAPFAKRKADSMEKEQEALAEDDRDMTTPKKKRAKVNPPGYTEGPQIKFLKVSSQLTARAKGGRGYPRVVDLQSFGKDSNKQNFTMADVVATVMWNHQPESLKAFFDLETKPAFSFVRKEGDSKKRNFAVERTKGDSGMMLKV